MATQGLPVISDARKLIFRVPDTAETTTFPEGANISNYGQNNQNPTIVVCNKTDGGSWQGADSRNGVVIMNEVPGNVAESFLNMYDGTVVSLKRICALASSQGYGDQYTTSTSFVDSKLTPAGMMLSNYTGIVKRDERDISFVYRDSTSTLQIVANGSPRRIEPDILLRTYRNVDGSQIDLTAVPTR